MTNAHSLRRVNIQQDKGYSAPKGAHVHMPRTGQKVLSQRAVLDHDEKTTAALCVDAHGFSLHGGVRCDAHQRKELERLCRHIARPAIANERQLWSNSDFSFGSSTAVA